MREIIKSTVMQSLPVVGKTLLAYGEMPVSQYIANLKKTASTTVQPRADLVQAVMDYTNPLLGEQTAKRVSMELDRDGRVLTANHHGVDYFAQSVQSNILYYLESLCAGRPVHTIPVLSCAGISVSNSSFPRGLLVYDAVPGQTGELPLRLPLLPDSWSQRVVVYAPPFTKTAVHKVVQKLDRLMAAGVIGEAAGQTAMEILQQDYLDDFVLGLPDYCAQATVLNYRLGRGMFARESFKPDTVYLPLEDITARLLTCDLQNCASLVYKCFFDADLCRMIISSLDGRNACWNVAKLTERLQNGTRLGFNPLVKGGGTVFFWAVDNKGRKFPLNLTGEGNSRQLAGVDLSGKVWHFTFSPDEIGNALKDRQIYPSLFTSYLTISMARGVGCLGGYFQSEYLPVMQKGLVAALATVPSYADLAQKVAAVPTDRYLSGMMGILVKGISARILPAGPLEIIARGGLDHEYIDSFLSLTVAQAHEIGMISMYPDIASAGERMTDWQEVLMPQDTGVAKFVIGD